MNDVILVVDDIPSNLHSLYHILKDEYSVKTANTGEVAIEKAVSEKPDLILLDIMMPDMNGYEVLTALKEQNETRNIPVIFITGLSEAEDETKGLVLGAVDYITKPFNHNIVRARVKTHLQIVRQMRLIEHYAMIDSLTGIANRRKFDQTIESEWARARREQAPLALLMFDLDRFKLYNDRFGHPAGDALLQSLGKIITTHARRPADLAARIGGEEFAIICPDTPHQAAMLIGERIRESVEAMVLKPDKRVTVSVGVAVTIPGSEITLEEFIVACDQKLYTAKESGRNRVCG